MRKIKIIYNNIIPVKGYCAITICYWIFARKKYEAAGLSDTTLNHESCHMAQQDDFIIPVLRNIIFYLWYLLEWIIKLPSALFGYDPYMSVSFEQEAYNNEKDLEYLNHRKKFSWLQYLFKLVK